jgi:hypothetical protein
MHVKGNRTWPSAVAGSLGGGLQKNELSFTLLSEANAVQTFARLSASMLMLHRPDRTKNTLLPASPLQTPCVNQHLMHNFHARRKKTYLVKHAAACRYPHELATCGDLGALKLGQGGKRRAVFDFFRYHRTLLQCALGGRRLQGSHGVCILQQLGDEGARSQRQHI